MNCPADQMATEIGCLPTNPVDFVQKVYGYGLSLISMVALLFLVIGGYCILSSQGNPEKLQKGKEYIFYSIAGLLLAVFGFVFVRIITGVIKIPGFS